jgi:arylsulfatase A-like enzyme
MSKPPGWLFVLLALLAGAATAAEPRRSVILISVDALRPDHMSCYGYPRKTTPHLDKLAARGVNFMDATSLIPLTTPSLSTLFASRPPALTGSTRNGLSLLSNNETLPQILRGQGYTTAAVVSEWPLHGSRSGLKTSFDIYQDRLMRKYALGLKIERDARWVTHRAQADLQAGLPEPFFLWLHYADPHRPHHTQLDFSFPHPPGDDSKPTRVRDRYDSEVAHADRWIGVLLDDLQARGLLDNSLVIILSDHGEGLGEHFFFGHGRRLYQNILHIPLILAGPNLPPGKQIKAPVQMLDIAPTVLAYLGLPKGAGMQGRNLMAAIEKDQLPQPEPIFFETYGVAVPVPSLKKLEGGTGPVAVGMRLGSFKITYSFRHRTWEFYNLDQDPQEQHNLFDPQNPEFRVLAGELRSWYQARNLPGPAVPGI